MYLSEIMLQNAIQQKKLFDVETSWVKFLSHVMMAGKPARIQEHLISALRHVVWFFVWFYVEPCEMIDMEWMILVSPFQFRILYDPINLMPLYIWKAL